MNSIDRYTDIGTALRNLREYNDDFRANGVRAQCPSIDCASRILTFRWGNKVGLTGVIDETERADILQVLEESAALISAGEDSYVRVGINAVTKMKVYAHDTTSSNPWEIR